MTYKHLNPRLTLCLNNNFLFYVKLTYGRNSIAFCGRFLESKVKTLYSSSNICFFKSPFQYSWLFDRILSDLWQKKWFTCWVTVLSVLVHCPLDIFVIVVSKTLEKLFYIYYVAIWHSYIPENYRMVIKSSDTVAKSKSL